MPLRTPSPHRWLVQLCTLATFVLSLGWVSKAAASVPMCGSHAQTVAAPPIGTPASSDELRGSSPCDEVAPLRAAGVPEREAPEKLTLPDFPIRALPVLPRLPRCPAGARLSPAAPEHELEAAGFARALDRPPRV